MTYNDALSIVLNLAVVGALEKPEVDDELEDMEVRMEEYREQQRALDMVERFLQNTLENEPCE